MPTELGPPFETWNTIDPPQMMPEDIPTWQTFRKAFGEIFLHFYYNVKLGGQLLDNQTVTENIRKSWYYSTAKRVDAVGETKDEVWLIEVTENPGIRAIGQCAAYRALWAIDPKINKPAVSVLVVHRIDQDLRFAASVEGVRVMEV
jgi:hypothetical protein